MESAPEPRPAVRPPAELVELVRAFDGPNAPQRIEPAVVLGAIQRFVENERMRNRRVLLFMALVFAAIGVMVFTLFLWVGMSMLRHAREAVAIADDVQTATAVLASETIGMSNRLARLAESSDVLGGRLSESEAERERERLRLKNDLERFGRWIEGRVRTSAEAAADDAAAAEQVRRMESVLADRDAQIADMRRQYEDLTQRVRALQAEMDAARVQDSAPVPAGMASDSTSVVVSAQGSATVASGPSVTDLVSQAAEVEPLATEVLPDPETAAETPAEGGPVSVVEFRNGDRYEGQFRRGLFHGMGTLVHANGDRYEGEFANDAKQGRGRMVYHNGDSYSGDFRANLRHGQGTMTYRTGEKYTGGFVRDMPQGTGAMEYANGNRYTGEFRSGLRHGKGTLRFFNGDVYEGDFHDDGRSGSGTYTFADGSRYVGQFLNGLRHGQGRYTYASGEEYEGIFVDGRKHGRGRITYPGGQVLEGYWENDEFVRAVTP